MGKKDPRIDAYIEKSAEFAKPILTHLRSLVHEACPSATETMKWSRPHFDYKGLMCGLSSFKAHCIFTYWKASTNGKVTYKEPVSVRMESMKDLPRDAEILRLVKQAATLNDAGVKQQAPARSNAKPPVDVPDYFMASLRKNKKALAAFDAFPPSHKREYVEWITEAKGEDTRGRRIASAIEWIAEGKPRNWKYMP